MRRFDNEPVDYILSSLKREYGRERSLKMDSVSCGYNRQSE